MAYPEYDVIEQPTLQERLVAKFWEITKKIGLKKIGAGLAVLFLVAWFLLQPQPGSVAVHVVEMDSEKPLLDPEVTLYRDGEKIGKGQLPDARGDVFFSNVPAGKQVEVRVDPGPSYKPKSVRTELKSGEKKNMQVELPRNWELELSVGQPKLVLGAGCSRNLTASVKNAGQTAEVELVGDGVLKDLVSSSWISIPKGLSSSIIARISAPSGESYLDGVGVLRVKKSDASTSVAVESVKPTDLDVSPNSIVQDVAPGAEVKHQILLTNRGDKEEIADVVALAEGEIAEFSQISLLDTSAIRPGVTNIATFVSRIPVSAAGTKTGTISISTSCKPYRVPVRFEVRPPSN